MQAVKKENPYNLYEGIQKICEQRHISIAELERKTGLGNGVIRKWDHASPTLRTILAVTDYLGVTLNDLMGRPEKEA